MSSTSNSTITDIEVIDLHYASMTFADLHMLLLILHSGRPVRLVNISHGGNGGADDLLMRLAQWHVAEHEARVRKVRERGGLF